jgi:hypothetical protein
VFLLAFHRGTTHSFVAGTEIFSYVTEARCYAVGQQADLRGAFDPSRQLDMSQAPYSLDNTHKSHSGQFRSTNMSRATIWRKVLEAMDLK